MVVNTIQGKSDDGSLFSQIGIIANIILNECLKIQPGERLCIVMDNGTEELLVRALFDIAQDTKVDVFLLGLIPADIGGREPGKFVEIALSSAQAIVNLSTYPIGHTDTWRKALSQGARALVAPRLSKDMLVRGGVYADYRDVERLSNIVAEQLTKAKSAKLTTSFGTDLNIVLSGRIAKSFYGRALSPGDVCGFPDGEGTIAPVEGTASGRIVNPFCVEKVEIGYIYDEFVIEIEKGEIVEVSGGAQAREFQRLITSADVGIQLAELAIGTNPSALPGLSMREAKKAKGLIHLAFGDSQSIGGAATGPLHVDLMIHRGTLLLDDDPITSDGKLKEV